ncbi:hypothetical protein AK812_SmicGene42056 [Symbiodinium microadriaticum]|uniref:Transmembrane protein n=1 Tax=Symbiodinium microadriaticum TaxID=2951 RepID=A0A1Q9C4I7_SYMMI|nr:hypothetical protein AK812_SmicGene42056 [Symbiodinium microadriaticum]
MPTSSWACDSMNPRLRSAGAVLLALPAGIFSSSFLFPGASRPLAPSRASGHQASGPGRTCAAGPAAVACGFVGASLLRSTRLRAARKQLIPEEENFRETSLDVAPLISDAKEIGTTSVPEEIRTASVQEEIRTASVQEQIRTASVQEEENFRETSLDVAPLISDAKATQAWRRFLGTVLGGARIAPGMPLRLYLLQLVIWGLPVILGLLGMLREDSDRASALQES